MTSRIVIKALDHVVLTVRDVPKTVEFYTTYLGMTHELFRSPKNPEVERHALRFGSQKINLHSAASPWQPHAAAPGPGTADLCFLTDTPIQMVLEEIRTKGLEVLEGGQIVYRAGAVGKLKSLYVRDPDGNLVEISNYA